MSNLRTNTEIKHRIEKLEQKLIPPASVKKSNGIFFTFIAEIISGIFIGVATGYFTDRFFNTTPICISIFTILGFLASMLNIYRTLYKKEFQD